MLQKVQHDNGVVFFRSPAIEAALETSIPHGFTTRLGGVSKDNFASLNLGWLAKDDQTDGNTLVAHNFRKCREATGFERRALRTEINQVHGNTVVEAPETIWRPDEVPEADGLLTDQPGRMLVVRTADCVPVLFAGRQSSAPRDADSTLAKRGVAGGVVGVVHAGWRGVVQGVVVRMVEAMLAKGVAVETLAAAIGPCISREWFEVGEEVVAAFEEVDLGEATGVVVREGYTKPHVDLQLAVRLQLERAGVMSERIDGHDLCTYAMDDLFFSYRRDVTHGDQQRTGHMAAVIGLP